MIKWIAELPSTNFRIFVSVLLAILYVAVTLGGVVLGRIAGANDSTLYMLGGFLLVMMGLDVAQFKVKRDTYTGSPPSPPDREDKPGLQKTGDV